MQARQTCSSCGARSILIKSDHQSDMEFSMDVLLHRPCWVSECEGEMKMVKHDVRPLRDGA